MKNNKKGGTSLKRPMHIRLLAFLMAVVMVISVMIIHNRNGKVEAADPITDETYLGQDGWLEEAHYTVYVPRTDITFTLPELPGDSMGDGDEVTVYVKKDGEGNITEWLLEDDKSGDCEAYTVMKYTTTSFAWSNNETTITSSTDKTSITATKTVTLMYMDGQTDITAALSVNQPAPDEEAIQIDVVTYAPQDITVDASVNITDPDNVSGDATTFNYGDFYYKIDDTDLLSASEMKTALSNMADGTYSIKKYITMPDNKDKVLYEAAPVQFTKNTQLVTSYSIVQGSAGGPEDGYNPEISFTGANPANDVMVSFETDSNATATANVGTADEFALTSVGNKHAFTIPGNALENNGKTKSYTVTLDDGAGMVQNVAVSVSYGNGAPKINAISFSGTYDTETGIYINNGHKKSDKVSKVISLTSGVSAGDASVSEVKLFMNDEEQPVTLESDGSINVEYNKDDLPDGKISFKIEAKSDYGLTATPVVGTVFKDMVDPVVGDVVLTQGESDTVIPDGGKLNCNKDAKITITASDAESGLSRIEVTDNAGFSANLSPDENGKVSFDILKEPEKNSSKTITYTITAVDKAGNVSEVKTKTVTFYNNKLNVDYEVLPGFNEETRFVQWKIQPDKTVAYIRFAVKSETPVNDFHVSIVKGDITAKDDDHCSSDGSGDGIYYFKYNLTYSNSITTDKILFYCTNTAGGTGKATVESIKIDILAPKTVSDPEFKKITGWTHNLILTGSIVEGDDGGPISQIKSATYSITNSVKDVTNKAIAIDSNGVGVINFEVPQSLDKKGTTVTFTLTDNALNTKTESYVFYVDNTPPKASLEIEGLKEKKEYLNKDPLIKYGGEDELSGLEEGKAFSLKINGTEYKNANGKTLSQIIGSINDSTRYTVELTVTDRAGKNTVIEKSFFVDVTGPDITVTKSKPGKYINSSVDVTVLVKDNNLDKNSISISASNGSGKKAKNIEFKLQREVDGDPNKYKFTIDGSKWNGLNRVTVSASDMSGNNTIDKKTSFVIDTKAPEITLQISKDGKNWKDYSVSDPSLEYIKFYPHIRAKVVDDNENEETETIEVACEPFKDTNSTSETIIGKSYSFEKSSAQGLYTITFFVEDKAGNVAKNVTEGAVDTNQMSIGFGLDFTAPKHNMYITSANPVNFERFNNTYKNLTGKFNKKYENYKYGQYYSGEVTIDLSAYDNSTNYNGEVTIMHKYRAPGESVATLYEDNEHVTFEGEADWEEDSDQHRKYKTITVDEAGDHEIWLKSSDHDDPNDGIGGCNTKEDTAHLFFTIDDTAPEVGLYLNGSPYNSDASNLYSSSVSTYASVTDNNIDYIVRNYTINPPGGSAITSSIDNYENASSELFETEADYTIDYTAYDRAGASNGPLSMVFRVDRTAPELTITGPGETTTNKSTVTFNLKEAFYSDMPAAKVTIYRRVDGIGEKEYESFDFNPNSANDSRSRTFDEDGEYRMEFTAEDKTGNSSKANYTFFQDADAPVITLGGVKNYDMTDTDVDLGVTVNETFYSTNNVKLTGTRTDIDGEKEILNFDNFPSNSSISTLRQVFTLDGIYDIKVTSKDKVGNESSQDIHFTIDKTNPLINELPIKDGEVLNKFTWDVDVDKLIKDLTVCEINIYIDGVLYDGVSEVADGVHVLKIEATDEMGNKSSEEINFTIDSIAPNIMISGVEDGQKVESAPTVNVSVQLDDDILSTVKLDGKDITVDGNEATFTVDKKGSHKIEATATDKAGNEASTSIEFVYGSSVNLMPVFIIAGILILLLIIGFIVYRMRKNQA